jgi:hypothetical protein
MPRRFDSAYKTKRLDNLGDPDWHDRRWQDIDLRMAAREQDATKIDDAVDRMEAVALTRLNDTFSPLIQQAMNQLADVGISFTGQSLSSHTIGLGEKVFIITEQYRVGFVVVDFVSIRPTGVPDRAMICSVASYDRTSGTLTVEPQVGYITGSGTYDDWQIRVSVTPNLDTYSRQEVDGLFDAMVGAAPITLDTLEKIAIAIGGSPNEVMLRGRNLGDLTNATQARINIGLGNADNTSDLTKPVSAPQQAAINAVLAGAVPVGTTMMFAQNTVPSGWIRITTHHDKAIRIVNTTGGSSGGTISWTTAFTTYRYTDYTTLDGNTLPSHAHSVYDPTHYHTMPQVVTHEGGYPIRGQDPYYGEAQSTNYGGTGISIYAAGGSAGHRHGLDMRVQYVDVLLGQKS